ncbi:hypothetical protein [Glycomyces algeriensis]|uniref:hypothetical protein n=1 Tax=Glycomyces algeriensis TaxID=256037 RepID=UPI0022DDF7FC|nr:hypothetical protein [Glycomyces algeriensis]
MAVVIILARPLPYRNQLPAAWGDDCLGDPAVISDVFSPAAFSQARIDHGRFLDDPWYECSWTWNPGGGSAEHQSISLEVKVLADDEFEDYSGLIETIRSSDFEQIDAESIAGFDSGYCSSSIGGTSQFVCRGAAGNLQVGIVATGGNDEVGDSGITVEDYLVEVGAFVREQLAR